MNFVKFHSKTEVKYRRLNSGIRKILWIYEVTKRIILTKTVYLRSNIDEEDYIGKAYKYEVTKKPSDSEKSLI